MAIKACLLAASVEHSTDKIVQNTINLFERGEKLLQKMETYKLCL